MVRRVETGSYVNTVTRRSHMRCSILVVLLLLTGCVDIDGERGLSTGPQPRGSQADLIATSLLASDFWAGLSQDERREGFETIRRVYVEQGQAVLRGRVLILEGPLPVESGGLILQDPASPEHPILVISGMDIDGDPLVQGITAYMHSISSSAHGTDSARWSILPYRLPEFPDVDDPDPRRLSGVTVGTRSLTSRVWELASTATPMNLPGMGRGMLFIF
jgi:hypothetical protein